MERGCWERGGAGEQVSVMYTEGEMPETGTYSKCRIQECDASRVYHYVGVYTASASNHPMVLASYQTF